MACMEVQKQRPRIATSSHFVKAYCKQRGSSLSIRPSDWLTFTTTLSDIAHEAYREIATNKVIRFWSDAVFVVACESSQRRLGQPTQQRSSLIRLQSLELCYTEGSSGGFFFFVLPFIFSQSLWCIINQPSFKWDCSVFTSRKGWTAMAQN